MFALCRIEKSEGIKHMMAYPMYFHPVCTLLSRTRRYDGLSGISCIIQSGGQQQTGGWHQAVWRKSARLVNEDKEDSFCCVRDRRRYNTKWMKDRKIKRKKDQSSSSFCRTRLIIPWTGQNRCTTVLSVPSPAIQPTIRNSRSILSERRIGQLSVLLTIYLAGE